MVGGAPAPEGRVALCPRFTATSVAALSRTSRPSSIAHREPAPSSRCPRPRLVPAHHRSSTSTRPSSEDPTRIRHRTATRLENEHGAPGGAPCRCRCRGWLQLHDVLRRGAFLGLDEPEAFGVVESLHGSGDAFFLFVTA